MRSPSPTSKLICSNTEPLFKQGRAHSGQRLSPVDEADAFLADAERPPRAIAAHLCDIARNYPSGYGREQFRPTVLAPRCCADFFQNFRIFLIDTLVPAVRVLFGTRRTYIVRPVHDPDKRIRLPAQGFINECHIRAKIFRIAFSPIA